MATALKFEIGLTTVEFLKEETGVTEIENNKDIELLLSQANQDILYKSQSNKTLTVNIIEYYKSTKDKIDQIVDAGSEMKIYYEYRYDPTKYYNVILIHESGIKRTKIYMFGEEAAYITHKLTFIQSS